MYNFLFHAHSGLRYLALLLLLVVIIKALMGWTMKQPFGKLDKQLVLFNMITAHIQLTLGLCLYFQSPFVQFGEFTMKDPTLRYWTVEHITMMLIAITIITASFSSTKRMTDENAKFKRIFILNAIALAIIVGAIIMSKRGLF